MVIPANGVFFGLWHAKDISAKIETGRREARPMDLKEPRIWYAVAAVIIVLIIIGYTTGWFGGAPAPAPSSELPRRTQTEPSETAVVTHGA